MSELRVDGVSIHYEWRDGPGSAGAAPIVLLHGLGSSCGDWSLQVPVLGARHPLLLVDLRGHGRSSHARGAITIEAMAGDVQALLGRLGAPAAHVVGLSLGGCVALALALRAPERVRSLILVNAFARRASNGARGAARLSARLALLACAPMSVVARHVASGLFPRRDQRELHLAAARALEATPRGVYVRTMLALARFDARRALASVRCPTLVIAGDRDGTVPLHAKRALADGIAGAKLLVVTDSGHATPWDQPDEFNRAVLDFIGGSPGEER